jgi:hypothetical protein
MAECRLTSRTSRTSRKHLVRRKASHNRYSVSRFSVRQTSQHSSRLCRATLRLTAFTTPRSPFFDPSPNGKLQRDGKAWNRPVPVSPRQALALHRTMRLKDLTSLTLVYDPAMAPMHLPQFASFITAALLEGQWRTRRCLSHPEKPRGRIRSPSLDI